ncbi:LPXTG cell wall anchor domain-containing protein [Aquibacillus albus]|uniref:DUF3955 domain-containing protein n=1 Tax=Aquibacillus albus TaxID=1168171 RepID=A0ABS2MXJ3_9BACI|nr:LPXTG cell wall anchor domain-containing protein [Aquibacillus albus]MBM7570556.1 hypothetical protein [Aquibacillus albus]
MKKIEWLIVILLITMGLGCLTVSATTMWGTESFETYLTTFLQLCLWMGLPILILGIVYLLFLKKRKNNKK